MFRAFAARRNYLGQDRAGVQCAAKEISRFTSKSEEQGRRAKLVQREVGPEAPNPLVRFLPQVDRARPQNSRFPS